MEEGWGEISVDKKLEVQFVRSISSPPITTALRGNRLTAATELDALAELLQG
jgi:hypothetical protein